MTAPPHPILVLAAAPAEVVAIARGAGTTLARHPHERQILELTPNLCLARTGIGKVNAAIAAATLATPQNCRAVVNLGICGSLPGPDDHQLPPGSVIVATECIYADEGVATPDGFLDCTAIGFPLSGDGASPPELFAGSRVFTDSTLRATILAAFPSAVAAPIATVSTCSGTDALAHAVAARTSAAAEAMEGAAIGHALACLHRGAIPFCEVRVVSNNTGDRAKQRWDMRAALASLERLSAAIASLAAA